MRLLALLALVVLICGCVSPLSEKKVPSTTPAQTVVEGKFKELNDAILKGLRSVFGNVTVVDVIEDENFMHATYKLPKNATDDDFERFVGSLGFKIEDIDKEMREALMTANLNGKVYEVHLVLSGDYVDVDAELKS